MISCISVHVVPPENVEAFVANLNTTLVSVHVFFTFSPLSFESNLNTTLVSVHVKTGGQIGKWWNHLNTTLVSVHGKSFKSNLRIYLQFKYNTCIGSCLCVNRWW